jgi:hypothetical protein
MRKPPLHEILASSAVISVSLLILGVSSGSVSVTTTIASAQTITQSPATSAAGQPLSRACHSAAYADHLGGTVVCGGATQCGVNVLADDTLWLWNGDSWRALGAGGPSPREDAQMVYVSARRSLILYGGRREGTVYTDTWEWSDGRWRQLATRSNPGPLQHAAAAYDAKRQRLVVFGGAIGRDFQSSTWELVDGDWIRVSVDASPPARVGHSMIADPVTGVISMYGGFASSGEFRDLWRFTGSRWIDERITGPTTSEGPALVFIDGALTVLGPGVGGTTIRAWSRVGSEWRELAANGAPPVAVGAITTYDTARKRIVVTGGVADQTGSRWIRVAEHTGAGWVIR